MTRKFLGHGYEDIATRLAEVKARMVEVGLGSGLAVADPVLVAVSKTVDKEDIEKLLKGGHRNFGENRVQEASRKWRELKTIYPRTRLHLIGPLQTNKLKEALEIFDVIETVDRMKLARELARYRNKGVSLPKLFIQVNTGEEPQKGGLTPLEVDKFIETCMFELDLPITGLMCIPPVNEEPSPHFALLREIGLRHGLPSLSMGMSNDFEIALAFGATNIRVGTAIFGTRSSSGP